MRYLDILHARTLDTKIMDNQSNFIILDNKTVTQILQELNDNEAAILLPVIVYVLVLMVFGVIGNLIVLYIYKFRFRRSSSRAFILCLAMLDLVTCLFGIPFHVIDMRYPYLFVWDIPCKTVCFLMTSTIFSSTFILVLISIERYRKICLPFEKQISDIGTKSICGGCIFMGFAFSSPVLMFYGATPFETNVFNVTGSECYISHTYRDSIFPLVYDTVSCVLFVIATCTLLVLYSRIGMTVWRKGTFQGYTKKYKNNESSAKGSEQSKCYNSDGAIELSNMITRDQRHPALIKHANTFDEYSSVALRSPKLRKSLRDKATIQMDIRRSSLRLKRTDSKRTSNRVSLRSSFRLKAKSISDDSSSESFSSTLERKSKLVRERLRMTSNLNRKQRRSLRITGMLTLITIVFVLSFLPYLTISILNGIYEDFWTHMTSSEILLYNFLLRTYFVNNMANPLIYSFLDEKFRSEVRKMFKYSCWTQC